MRSTTRKGLPLPEITDAYNQNFVVGPPGRTFNITGVVRDTDNAQSSILDNMTEYNQDEDITGRWIFHSPINVQGGIGRRFQNNTGSQRVLGDVVMLDPANDMSILQPNAAGLQAGKIGVVAETIPAGQVGYVAFDGFINVHVVGGTTRLSYLQSQQNSYTAAATTLGNTGSFAVAVTSPDTNNMVVACLSIVGSVDGGGTIHGGLTIQVAGSQNAWVLDSGPLSAAGVQSSPRALWRANSYDTANHQRNFIWRARSTTNAGAGIFELITSLDAGAETVISSLDNTGLLTVVGGVDVTAAAETFWLFPASISGDIPNRTRFRARTNTSILNIWPAADHVSPDSQMVVWMGAVEPASASGAYVSLGSAAANNQAILGTGGQLAGQANSPALVLAPAGTARMTLPGAGTIQVVGDMTMTGNLSSANGTHTGTLNVTGATGLGSTLTVAGMSSLAALTVTGNTTLSGILNVNGAAAFATSVTMQGAASVASTFTVGGAVSFASSVNGYYFMSGSGTYYFVDGSMYITRSGGEWVASHQLGVPVIRISGGTIQDIGGATLYVTNHIQTAYDATIGRSMTVNGNTVLQYCHVASRLVTNSYDVGWPNNFGGNAISSGYFYQRGRSDARCWDTLDFTFSPSNVGNYLVQRDGNGGFTAGNITCYGLQCWGDMNLYTSFFVRRGDGTVLFQVSANSGEVLTNSDMHCADAIVFYQVAAYNSWNGRGNANAFLAPNNGDYTGQGLANQWRTWSCVDHAVELGLRNAPVPDALSMVRKITGYSYDHVNFVPDGSDMLRRDGKLVTTPLLGFKASEIQEYFPEIAGEDQVDYNRLVPVLWEAVKELSGQVTALQALIGKH